MAPHDGNSSFPVTPRSPVRQHSPAETDTTADDAPLERPRLSTSAARRMRRKRAAERAQQAAEQSRNNEGTRTAPLSAGRATWTFVEIGFELNFSCLGFLGLRLGWKSRGKERLHQLHFGALRSPSLTTGQRNC